MKDESEQVWVIAVVFLFFAVGLFFGTMGGWEIGIGTEQRKAIEAGVGRWTIESKTGKKQFEYGQAKESK